MVPTPDDGVTARLTDSSLVEARGIDAPGEIVEGESFTVTASIRNNASFISSGDPDSCEGPVSGATGYDIRIEVERFGDTITTANTCIGVLTTQDVDITVPGVDQVREDTQLGYTLYAANTGTELGSTSTTVSVIEAFDPSNVSVTCNGVGASTVAPGDTFEPEIVVENDNPDSLDATLEVRANGSTIHSQEIRVALGATYTPVVTAPTDPGDYQIEATLTNVRSAFSAPASRSPFRRLIG